MNYIREINGFYDHIERNPLSASAVTLWHALMHINNKAMWTELFTVAAPVLRLKSGLKDSSFKRARTELKEKGYIDYQSRGSNQAPVYRMISLSNGMNQVTGWDEGQQVDWNTDQGMDQVVDHSMDHKTNRQTDPLIKLNKDKIKQNQKKQNDVDYPSTDAFAFYQDNFGVISPFVADSLLNWVADMGEDLVLDAMKRALEQGKSNWGYVKAILQAWVKKGIISVEAANAEEMEFRRGQQERKKHLGHEEVIPDWFREQKHKQKLRQEQERVGRQLRDPDMEREEFEKLLAEYRGEGRVCSVGYRHLQEARLTTV